MGVGRSSVYSQDTSLEKELSVGLFVLGLSASVDSSKNCCLSGLSRAFKTTFSSQGWLYHMHWQHIEEARWTCKMIDALLPSVRWILHLASMTGLGGIFFSQPIWTPLCFYSCTLSFRGEHCFSFFQQIRKWHCKFQEDKLGLLPVKLGLNPEQAIKLE